MSDYDIVSASAETVAAIEAEKERNKELFISDFTKNGRGDEKQALKAWEDREKANTEIRNLDERSGIEIMDFAPFEKAWRIRLEAEGWEKQVIENTIASRRTDFENKQVQVKARLEAAKYTDDERFRLGVLNPATRKETLKRYLIDRVDKAHFLVEAIELMFELNEKKRR